MVMKEARITRSRFNAYKKPFDSTLGSLASHLRRCPDSSSHKTGDLSRQRRRTRLDIPFGAIIVLHVTINDEYVHLISSFHSNPAVGSVEARKQTGLSVCWHGNRT